VLIGFKFVLLHKVNGFRTAMVNKNTTLKVTVKTFFGLEAVLMEELQELGFSKLTKLNRAVQVEINSWSDVYFLNLHLRCALSVLVEVATFDIKKEADLYQKCMQIDWTSYFTVDKTFAVKGAVFTDVFKHSQYPFLLVKDAIVDTFRKKEGGRPDVNVKSPQVLFDLHISGTKVTLSLNTSGAPLFQRGYREATGEAPLNEVVAAALIRMSGWDKKTDLIDPFCGSGTILIEAALYATGIPSNIERQHYAFKNFRNFDPEIWEAMWNEANIRVASLPCRISGSDKSAEMITKSRRNLRRLAIGRFVETAVQDFDEVRVTSEKGIMITNPPYGERLEANIEELYQGIGDWMKQELKGHTCWIISSSETGFKAVGLKPDKKFRLYNGELECSYRSYSIFAGSHKEQKARS
jgi:putative N6-adenine-specific DNA methylase